MKTQLTVGEPENKDADITVTAKYGDQERYVQVFLEDGGDTLKAVDLAMSELRELIKTTES